VNPRHRDSTAGRAAPGTGIVEATERLYRTLFTAASGFAVASVVWGLVIAPLNDFNHHVPRSIVIGGVAVAVALVVFLRRDAVLGAVRSRPSWILLAVLLSVAVLWSDGGWRSSFYVASYSPIVFAAVALGVRWALICAALLAVGYLTGLAINGYSWEELGHLKDQDSVIANTGGYLIAGYFLAAPIAWLGSYVVRINQVFAEAAAAPTVRPEQDSAEGEAAQSNEPQRGSTLRRTATLSVREVQVSVLLAEGLRNEDIAARLNVSPRTVQNHVANAMRKTGARNRTALGVLVVRENLAPKPDDDDEARG
jgi:DNA-binding CsgD family transcriptional regulator